jgi:hypothetical protein
MYALALETGPSVQANRVAQSSGSLESSGLAPFLPTFPSSTSLSVSSAPCNLHFDNAVSTFSCHMRSEGVQLQTPALERLRYREGPARPLRLVSAMRSRLPLPRPHSRTALTADNYVGTRSSSSSFSIIAWSKLSQILS